MNITQVISKVIFTVKITLKNEAISIPILPYWSIVSVLVLLRGHWRPAGKTGALDQVILEIGFIPPVFTALADE